MPHIIGVKFRNGGKSYYFTPGSHQVKQGDAVVVETSRGTELGAISYDLGEIELENSEMQIKEILRKATEEDVARAQENRRKEKEAYAVGQEKILSHGLDMKLIDVEYTFDNNKILFYFTADGRIDFRELVKDLAGVFRTRIELRQIGVRDETKMLGGMGICGRPLCCHAYLSDFVPVSIKMAKEQGLSLNPGKISGVCGRLMCCLKNEEEVYEEINARMPNQGDFVVSADGIQGEVATVNILRETVRVLVENGDEKEFHEVRVCDLTEVEHRKRRGGKNASGGSGAGHVAGAKDNEHRERRGEEEHKEGMPREVDNGAGMHPEQDHAGEAAREQQTHAGRRHHNDRQVGERQPGGKKRPYGGHDNQGFDGERKQQMQGNARHGRNGKNNRFQGDANQAGAHKDRQGRATPHTGAHSGGRDRNYRHRGPRNFAGDNGSQSNGYGEGNGDHQS